MERVYQGSNVRQGVLWGSSMDQGCPSRCVKVSSNKIVLEEALTLDIPIPVIALSSLDGSFRDLGNLHMGLISRPAGHRSRPI